MSRWCRWGTLGLLSLAVSSIASAEEWPGWRGPYQNGTSSETNLVSTWSPEGENLLWKAPFVGRSTPVVVGGQACVIGRVGEEIRKQEVVACYDARTGTKNWEHRFNVYHTTVAFNRVGWASLAGDPQTGNVYAHGVAGQLIAFDPSGNVIWERFLPEQFGRASGYGGRTQTPLVWGDAVLLTFVSVGWGDQAMPRHRYFSFDKNTGELNWVSTPGKMVFDMNTQSGPVVAEIDGRELLIAGNADGHVYGVDVATGNKVWSFQLSRRGLNSTVLVQGDVVFASHSEENLDDATQGRLVAFRASGEGDLTDRELWRVEQLTAGFPSPTYHEGKLYAVDNSANLYRIDAGTGTVDWEFELGTVGKASPVIGDGKMYVPELNGRLHILEITDSGARSLDQDEMRVDGEERFAEIYGSPAIAYERIFLSTEGWLYCIGDPNRPFRTEPRTAFVRVTPAEAVTGPGEPVTFRASRFDAKGRPIGSAEVAWSLEGLVGNVDRDGRFTPDRKAAAQAGAVRATFDGLTADARVRVLPGLPWSEDFESLPLDSVPGHWIGARGKFKVVEKDGGRVLQQVVRERGLQRSQTYIGADLSDYTMQVDVMGSRDRRRVTDVGLFNSGYTLDLMGYHQRLEVRSWAAEKRMAKAVDFAWEMDTWYTMKLEVRSTPAEAVIRGKVWKRGEPEPDAWTITVEDPLPITHGSPGLIGYAPSLVHYDNLKVTPNR